MARYLDLKLTPVWAPTVSLYYDVMYMLEVALYTSVVSTCPDHRLNNEVVHASTDTRGERCVVRTDLSELSLATPKSELTLSAPSIFLADNHGIIFLLRSSVEARDS